MKENFFNQNEFFGFFFGSFYDFFVFYIVDFFTECFLRVKVKVLSLQKNKWQKKTSFAGRFSLSLCSRRNNLLFSLGWVRSPCPGLANSINWFLFHRDLNGRGRGEGYDSHHRCRKSFFESWGIVPGEVFSQPLSAGFPRLSVHAAVLEYRPAQLAWWFCQQQGWRTYSGISSWLPSWFSWHQSRRRLDHRDVHTFCLRPPHRAMRGSPGWCTTVL